MFQFIKNKIEQFKKEKERQKKSSELFLTNADFAETIPNNKIENFFLYLATNYASDIVNIEYSKTKKNVNKLNEFYNTFFSKYESIIVATDEARINFSYIKENLEANFDDVVIIGKHEASDICIKINGNKNSLYIDELATQNDIDNEVIWWNNVFYYLIECISSNKEILIEQVYKEMIANEK